MIDSLRDANPAAVSRHSNREAADMATDRRPDDPILSVGERVRSSARSSALGAATRVATPVLKLSDRLRARTVPFSAFPKAPGACIAATAHYSTPGRVFLAPAVDSLLGAAPTVACAVFVYGPKSADAVAQELRDAGLEGSPPVEVVSEADAVSQLLEPGSRVVVIDTKLSGSPWGLTWAHKAVFRDLVLSNHVFERGVTHLVYSEDDMALAPDALHYWCDYRAPLAEHGLMPGFLRVEGPDGDLCVTGWRRESRGRPRVALPSTSPGGQTSETVWFVNFSNPYQAMYVLDEELANWHFRYSDFRSRGRAKVARTQLPAWGVPERAAAGPIFDGAIPEGFSSRNVLPLVGNGSSAYPLAASLIRHLPQKDYNDPDVPQGKQRVAAAFALDGAPVDVEEAGSGPL